MSRTACAAVAEQRLSEVGKRPRTCGRHAITLTRTSLCTSIYIMMMMDDSPCRKASTLHWCVEACGVGGGVESGSAGLARTSSVQSVFRGSGIRGGRGGSP
jgi:hypothetical protein